MHATSLRSHAAGLVSRAELGRTVRVAGWVHRCRDLGGLVFIDLRDRHGVLQLSCDPAYTPPEVLKRAASCGLESVILATGTVTLRPQPARDPGMVSREVEVQVTGLELLSGAATPAIPVARKEKEELPAEELRLKHRVLDLRRSELQANLLLRHRLLQRARRTLSELGFLELETPILTKPTPEGARDYLVPSRIHPGEFYALPQSPQIYKQLFMVAGFDRYFQIARCFRDEDLRADRQPEFTQIDLEASFVTQEDVLPVVETVLASLWEEAGQPVERPFPQPALERLDVERAVQADEAADAVQGEAEAERHRRELGRDEDEERVPVAAVREFRLDDADSRGGEAEGFEPERAEVPLALGVEREHPRARDRACFERDAEAGGGLEAQRQAPNI